jgi:hypothetical protein
MLHTLSVHNEQINHTMLQAVVVDHPYTAALTGAGARPANLSSNANARMAGTTGCEVLRNIKYMSAIC